jgi:hypothetical protein
MALALPTGPRGRTLALALTILVGVSVWFAVIAPLQQWYDDRAELLRRQQAMARRMNSLVETLPTLRREAGNNGAGNTRAVLLTGETDALAAASLQQRIDELAVAAGVRIGSEEILPNQTEGDMRAVAIRVTVAASFHDFTAWLLALARSETPMVVDELQLRGPPVKPAADLPVDANLTVTSYRAAKADAK